MRNRARNSLMVLSAVALATTAIAAPAAAAQKADVAFIQGMAGRKIDICVNGNELRSKVRYGAKRTARIKPGTRKIQIRKAAPGNCQGRKLAQRKIDIGAGADLSIAISRSGPKLIVFDNTGLWDLVPSAPNGGLAIRHAADIGPVEMRRYIGLGTPTDPSAVNFEKGDVYEVLHAADPWVIWARQQTEGVVASKAFVAENDRRHEIYLIGDRIKNVRFTMLTRRVENPF